MTRRYADQVEVKAAAGTPELFLWRGRVYQVRAVLAHWAEARPWWQEVGRSAAGASATADRQPPERSLATLTADWQVWRVEAGPGRLHRTGVFDLIVGRAEGSAEPGWTLIRVSD